ncbi:MAG: DNA-binding protein WhiA [Candidatus Avilachnospira sp.]|jgi:DNA-binding protein WhiA
MSFSSAVKDELRKKYFTNSENNSKIARRSKETDHRRELLRKIFLEKGSLSDPERFYHMEFVLASEEEADELRALIAEFGIEARSAVRNKHTVVYIKDSEAIFDMLNILGAHKSLMEFENVRILKEMREDVQRKVNCETANINKTVSAAVRQIEDIEYVKDRLGLKNLPENLRAIAELRLEKPDATLKELGELLEPSVSKSGVNHRLNKISAIADKLRKKDD